MFVYRLAFRIGSYVGTHSSSQAACRVSNIYNIDDDNIIIIKSKGSKQKKIENEIRGTVTPRF